MKIYYIYKLTAPNGKSYIGWTINLKARLQSHFRNNSLIGRALRKYGHFKIKLLWEAINKKEANIVEKAAIFTYNTKIPNGYNLTEGGEGGRPCKEVREKLSRSSKGNKNWLGKHHTEEAKKKIGIASRKRKCSKRTSIKISIAKIKYWLKKLEGE